MMMRWSVPVQLCLMLASALRVTYGEAGFCNFRSSSSPQHEISLRFLLSRSASHQSQGLQHKHGHGHELG